MKRVFPFLLLCLFLCLMPGCSTAPNGTEQLTVEAVRELAKKGEELAWSDLEPYYFYNEIGSSPGNVVRFYTVEPCYFLTAGGDTREERPEDISFYRNDSPANFDFRTDDLDAFLKQYPPVDSQT